jgi:hypothetical protein
MTVVDELVARTIESKSKLLRYIWILQLLVGASLLFLGYAMGHGHFRLIREGVRAPGRVVAHQQESFMTSTGTSSRTTTAFMPIVEFRAGGRILRFKDWLGSASIGSLPDRVTVLYDPANPAVAMIDRPVMNWIPWAPIGGVGLFLVIVAIKGIKGSVRAS